MGLFSRTIQVDFDLSEIEQTATLVGYKRIALDAVIDLLTRSFSGTKFLFSNETDQDAERLKYVLNERPNPNQNAVIFWKQLIETLFTEGEVLVVVKNNSWYVATSFNREQHVTGDIFSNVYIGDSTFSEALSGAFKRDDVFYLHRGDRRLTSYIDELWGDYGRILGRYLELQRTNGQVRATWLANITNKVDEDKEKLKKTVEGIKSAISNSGTAIIPISKQQQYQEYGNNTNNNVSVADTQQIKDQYLNDLSDLLGIPRELLRGDKLDNDKNYELFINTVIAPLQDMVVAELNAFARSTSQYQAGGYWFVKTHQVRDMFALSTQIDKLVASGSFNRNEIRAEFGFGEIPGGDEYFITKNYQSTLDAPSGSS